MSATTKPTILLIDDDPSHLKLYSWVVNKGGFRAIVALVEGSKIDLPRHEKVDLAVLDYRLGQMAPVHVAQLVNQAFPSKPIIVLSDMLWVPSDIAPYAAGFVRKGEPEQMLKMIGELTNSKVES